MRTFTDGKWDKTSTTLDDAKDINDLELRLKALGFLSHEKLTCRTGDAKLYIRQMLPGKKSYQFDYCCMLYVSGFVNTILLPDLPDVLLLLKEIDAQPKKPDSMSISIDNFSEIKDSLEELTEHLEKPTINITNFSELKTALLQVATLLKEIKTVLSASSISSVPTTTPPTKKP